MRYGRTEKSGDKNRLGKRKRVVLITKEQRKGEKMLKTLVSLLITLALILTAGIFEEIRLSGMYNKLKLQLIDASIAAENDELDPVMFDNIYNGWIYLKEASEFWVNHNDTNEMNLRMCECRSYVESGDMKQAHMQLTAMIFLAEYIPEAILPHIENIF